MARSATTDRGSLRAATRRAAALAMLVIMSAIAPALAVQPDEVLADPKLESRARALSAELRCLVCQNQSIDDSNAPLARDLRLLVRERLTAGESDDDVRRFVVARYGEFVLLRPPFSTSTLILWLGPPLMLLLTLTFLLMMVRRQKAAREAKVAPLSAAEASRLEALLKDERRS